VLDLDDLMRHLPTLGVILGLCLRDVSDVLNIVVLDTCIATEEITCVE
jgi:hypothetical protein